MHIDTLQQRVTDNAPHCSLSASNPTFSRSDFSSAICHGRIDPAHSEAFCTAYSQLLKMSAQELQEDHARLQKIPPSMPGHPGSIKGNDRVVG
ncbi:hypothetical protein A0H81_06164 [Grifola frondosa]|uniref:Uncharacterized protein n=1 Tax=Grifola frondosa TaxID=5627 RepID=A0A1C7MGA3_GRIFR|nr:hypothetical protein A0H81_06164 [Grifola frondosa]